MIFNRVIKALDRYTDAVERHTDVMSLAIPIEMVQGEFTKYLTTTEELIPFRTQRVKNILVTLEVSTVAELKAIDHARALLLLRE